MKDPKAFADSYQFAITLFSRTRSFPKHLRPTLGRRLEEESLLLTTHLQKALMSPVKNAKGTQTRLVYLQKSSDSLDDIRVLLRMSHDLKILPVAGFHELSLLGKEIGREIGGLIKATKIINQNHQPPASQKGFLNDNTP
jgi:hypothetical protein